MNAQRKVFRTRRSYNKWVADETLEDYSLRFTAKSARKWSASQVANTALGAVSFLALEAIGATITLHYGFSSAIPAILVVCLLIFFTCIPISYYASKNGIDIDLLTRGAGFGYVGSTITSLIYASFTFIFLAIEAAIMAQAMFLLFGLPLGIGYLLSALVVIPIVIFGITAISRFQIVTQPLWVVLQITPIAFLLYHDFALVEDWTQYAGQENEDIGFNWFFFGMSSAVVFSLIAQVGEQVDYLRFVPDRNEIGKRNWLTAVLSGGPGWIVVGAMKLIVGSFLVVVALNAGISMDLAVDPTIMYATAYSYVTNSPQAALLIAGCFVILSQLKINVTNAYAGSIAWSNFFSRLTHNHPGRVVWLVFNVIVAILVMELGVYHALERTLGVYSTVAVAWVGTLVADLIINKPLGLSPKNIEFRRGYLYDINPVGVGSMLLASILGFMGHAGMFGEGLLAFASYIALFSTFIFTPLIAVLTKSRFYLSREPTVITGKAFTCAICENEFEPEDAVNCPLHTSTICSLCCSLDSRCLDVCRPGANLSEQTKAAKTAFLPERIQQIFSGRSSHFLGVFVSISLLVALLFLAIYTQIPLDNTELRSIIAPVLAKIYIALLIMIGVVSWFFVLAKESRLLSLSESAHQTSLLKEEILAHEKTDRELQREKDKAVASNEAKSRYLTGISHELRSPLNALLGYAQLLEKASDIPPSRKKAFSIIRRSGEHLASLIEGLLDISKIEAGRLDIHRNTVNYPNLIEQITHMAKYQAEAKGLKFTYQCMGAFPEYIYTDEKQLRQILINLLTNAVKYTTAGEVKLTTNYRNQVAYFVVEDTGVGIAPDQFDRIFEPFERIHPNDTEIKPGTGLGLTITKLLSEVMGGDIELQSEVGRGSKFTLRIMLSDASATRMLAAQEKQIIGYAGQARRIVVVDDDPTHRSLITDALMPLGFVVTAVDSYDNCFEIPGLTETDVFLLDVNMPGRSGWEVAVELRHREIPASIIMTSADAAEGLIFNSGEAPYDEYMIKPLRLTSLLNKLKILLDIDWVYENTAVSTDGTLAKEETHRGLIAIEKSLVDELLASAKIGHIDGFNNIFYTADHDGRLPKQISNELKKLVDSYDFQSIIQMLTNYRLQQ